MNVRHLCNIIFRIQICKYVHAHTFPCLCNRVIWCMKQLWERVKWVLYSHGGYVFTGEGIGGVTYEQTGLTHSPEERESRGCEHCNTCIQTLLYLCVEKEPSAPFPGHTNIGLHSLSLPRGHTNPFWHRVSSSVHTNTHACAHKHKKLRCAPRANITLHRSSR